MPRPSPGHPGAEQGLACAAANLGMLWARGIGCDQDFATAQAGIAAPPMRAIRGRSRPRAAPRERARRRQGPRDGGPRYAMAAARGNDMAATAPPAAARRHGETIGAAARLLAGPAARGNAFAQHRLGLLYAQGTASRRSRRARTARPGRRQAMPVPPGWRLWRCQRLL